MFTRAGNYSPHSLYTWICVISVPLTTIQPYEACNLPPIRGFQNGFRLEKGKTDRRFLTHVTLGGPKRLTGFKSNVRSIKNQRLQRSLGQTPRDQRSLIPRDGIQPALNFVIFFFRFLLTLQSYEKSRVECLPLLLGPHCQSKVQAGVKHTTRTRYHGTQILCHVTV